MKIRPFTFICTHSGCTAQYNRKDRLEIHLLSHTGERPYVCTYDDCNKSYVRPQHLRRHEVIHEENKIKCPYKDCIIVLKTPATLKKHIDFYHLRKRNKIFNCSTCNKKFFKRCLLKVHEDKHRNLLPHKCSYEDCGKSFLTPSKLKRHFKVHQGYKCTEDGCNEISTTWSLHVKHLKVVHPAVHKCSTCSKVFHIKCNLMDHEAMHLIPEDRKVFECSVPNCNRFYFEMKNLRQHIKINHEGTFKCHQDSCSLSFPNKDSLRKHYQQKHDPDVPLSSKKRKMKTKKKKLTFAAKLAGLTEQKSVTESSQTKLHCNEESNMAAKKETTVTDVNTKHYSKNGNLTDGLVEQPNPMKIVSDIVIQPQHNEQTNVIVTEDKAAALPKEKVSSKDFNVIEVLLDDNAIKSFKVNEPKTAFREEIASL